MALSFILGRAGSGKTHRCIEHMRQDTSNDALVLLVPEQATYQMERAVYCNDAPNRGRIHVLSFGRLAWRVFSETGLPQVPAIDQVGKLMALAAIIHRRKHDLRVFGKMVNRGGFVETVSRCLKEFMDWKITVEDTANAATRVEQGSFLGQKLSDLSLIYAEYERLLEHAFTDPDKYLTLLSSRIPQSSLCRGAKVWVDGFTGFTAQEMGVLTSLMNVASSVKVALTVDPLDLADDSLGNVFYPCLLTLHRLKQVAELAGVDTEHSLILPRAGRLPRFCSEELGHLEAELTSHAPRAWSEPPRHIRLASAPDKHKEVCYVAAKLLELTRENGWRWKDFALLVHDLEAYKDTISSVFRRHNIPVFIDSRRRVTYHPVIELVSAVCEIISHGWPQDSVYRLLKTDLLECRRDMADRIENLALSKSVTGGMWKQPEQWADPDLASAVSSCLAPVIEADRHVLRTQNLFSGIALVLENLHVRQKIEVWQEQCVERGELEQASLHAQVYDGVVSLLEQANQYLSGESLTLTESSSVLHTALTNLTLGLVPPSLDQVIAASLDRSRHPSVKAAFVLGLSEAFPGSHAENALLSDREREHLLQCGIELGATTLERAATLEYLVYVALSRASRLVWLTRPLHNDEGKPVARSPHLDKLERIFPALREHKVDDGEALASGGWMEQVQDGQSALELLAVLHSTVDASLESRMVVNALYAALEAGEIEAQTEFLTAAQRPNSEKPLAGVRAQQLYGPCISMSVSRLEAFRSCAFKHFARYGLRLKTRPLGQLDAPAAGVFMHAALRYFLNYIMNLEQDIAEISDEEVRGIVAYAAERAEADVSEQIALTPGVLAELELLKRSLEQAGTTLVLHAKRGKYRPVRAELAFGPGTSLNSPEHTTSSGMRAQLVGRIDLVDAALLPDGAYFRVIDFKSRPKKLNIEDIADGLDLQLAGYLCVVMQNSLALFGREAFPSAMLYYPLRDSWNRQKLPPSDEDRALLRTDRRRMSGIVSRDTRGLRLMDEAAAGKSLLVPVSFTSTGEPRKSASVVEPEEMFALRDTFLQVMCESAEQIANGAVEIAPYRKGADTACDMCDFGAVCQFDIARTENRYRSISKARTQPEEPL